MIYGTAVSADFQHYLQLLRASTEKRTESNDYFLPYARLRDLISSFRMEEVITSVQYFCCFWVSFLGVLWREELWFPVLFPYGVSVLSRFGKGLA